MKFKCKVCGRKRGRKFLSGICPACCHDIETGEKIKDAIPTIFHICEEDVKSMKEPIKNLSQQRT